jgi:hypothetical protein
MEEDSKLHERIRKKVLYGVGAVEGEPVYFGENLLRNGYEEDMEKQVALVRKGLDLLKEPRRWDNERHKVRALNEQGKRIFVIYESSEEGNVYYFMGWDDTPWIKEELT